MAAYNLFGASGNANVQAGPATVTGQSGVAAAFGGSGGAPMESRTSIFAPTDSFGLAFWLGVLGVVGLVVLHHSLPA